MTWTLDATHSTIGFAVRHMMISKVRGNFSRFEASLDLDPKDLAASKVEATIEAASIQTGDEQRDNHLRSPDFLNAEQYPHIRFTSTGIEAAGEGRYRLRGDLTIRDVTQPIELDVEAVGPAKDPWGNQRLGFSIRGEIDREAFGLTWNQALEAGGVLVGKKVSLELEIEAMAAEGG